MLNDNNETITVKQAMKEITDGIEIGASLAVLTLIAILIIGLLQ